MSTVKSRLFLASDLVIQSLKELDDLEANYDLNKVIGELLPSMIDTHCRIWSFDTLDAVLRAITMGVFGRQSKARYFVLADSQGTGDGIWLPLFVKSDYRTNGAWQISPFLMQMLDDSNHPVSDTK